MAFQEVNLAVLLVGALVVGCHPSLEPVDTSDLVVQPGRGITNLCELGMSFSEIKQAAGGATTHGIYDDSLSWRRLESWGRGRFACFPSLGAVAPIEDDQPIAMIEFYVQRYRALMVPGLEVRNPFRGSLGESISFKDGSVDRFAIEGAFGTSSLISTNAAEALQFRKQGQDFVLQRGGGEEEVWYPKKGVAFVLVSNLVMSFQVFKPTTSKP
jgi:hypothetical protein